jgi:D-3-phosphoglycerate dehydrogenase
MINTVRRPKVLCTAPMHFLDHITEQFVASLDLVYRFGITKTDLSRIIGEFDAFVPDPGGRYTIDQTILKNAAKLEIIVTPSTGTDHIDKKLCERLGIKVASLRDSGTVIESIHASAEFSFLLLLSILKKSIKAANAAKLGYWREIEDQLRGFELHGKTVGLIGLGRIGKKMARYCNAFGAEVIAIDPLGSQGTSGVIMCSSTDELLNKADIVCLHIHLDENNHNFFGERQFSSMKPGAYFINTSRGGLVDEYALIDALKNNKIAGAAVDVIKNEQSEDLSTSPLIDFAKTSDKIIITPHIAGLTVDSQGKAAHFSLTKIKDFFSDD